MKRWITSALRDSFVHDVYAFFRYALPDIVINGVYRNFRIGRYHKVQRLLKGKWMQLYQDRPKGIGIDIVSVCNLRCPLCSVPPFLTRKDGNFMPLDLYRKICENIGAFANNITLVYAGEPFLHPQLGELINDICDDYYVEIISNGTLLGTRNNDLVIDKIDSLQISFDGFSKLSFEKYRVGADFEKVKQNILNLLKERKRGKSGLPVITVTFLINAYNEGEVTQCRSFWLSQGVDKFHVKYINLNAHRRLDGKTEEDLAHWLPSDKTLSLYDCDGVGIKVKERWTPCTSFLNPIVRCDGEILICCHDIFNTVKVGNLLQERLDVIWNKPQYKKIRNMARKRGLPVCQKCGK
jgi:MoaA/NifB/PqqE/SkfB family radical SAM enzyme